MQIKEQMRNRGRFFQIRKGYCNGKYYCCSPTYTTSARCERKSLPTEEQQDSHEIEEIEDRIEEEYDIH